MAEFIIDADGHIMEDHKDIFAHIKGNFAEMNWHSTWPMFDADGWQRGLARKGKREDPDAEALDKLSERAWHRHGRALPNFRAGVGHDPTTRVGLGAGAGLQRLALSIASRAKSPRLKGVALLAPQDPKAAAARAAPLRQRAGLLSPACCRPSPTTAPRSTARRCFMRFTTKRSDSTCR